VRLSTKIAAILWLLFGLWNLDWALADRVYGLAVLAPIALFVLPAAVTIVLPRIGWYLLVVSSAVVVVHAVVLLIDGKADDWRMILFFAAFLGIFVMDPPRGWRKPEARQ
jgi:hypothetical protein